MSAYLHMDHSREPGPTIIEFESRESLQKYVDEFVDRCGGSTMGWQIKIIDEIDDYQKRFVTTWKP
jgi:hypothetical protein